MKTSIATVSVLGRLVEIPEAIAAAGCAGREAFVQCFVNSFMVSEAKGGASLSSSGTCVVA